jgi:hypothetical protein
MSVLIMWAVIASIVGWGSYLLARRDPRLTAWTKITIAAVPLAIFVFDALCLYLIPNEVLVPEGSLPSGFLVPGMLVYFVAMAAIGAPLCIGCIVGILLEMYRGQH